MPKDAARAPVWREAYTEVSSNKPESMVVMSARLTWLAITSSINSSPRPLMPRKSSSFCCMEYCCAPGCPDVSGSRRDASPPRAFSRGSGWPTVTNAKRIWVKAFATHCAIVGVRGSRRIWRYAPTIPALSAISIWADRRTASSLLGQNADTP